MQCMALGRYKITWVYVYVCVCPKYLSFTIATEVFTRSSSNLECRLRIWQRRLSSVANNSGISKRACASNYFRFSLLLGLCPRYAPISRPIFFIKFGRRFTLPRARKNLSTTQPEVIYAHARNLTSVFYYFAQNALKCWFAAEMFARYRRMGSLNPSPMTNLRSEVELM